MNPFKRSVEKESISTRAYLMKFFLFLINPLSVVGVCSRLCGEYVQDGAVVLGVQRVFRLEAHQVARFGRTHSAHGSGHPAQSCARHAVQPTTKPLLRCPL